VRAITTQKDCPKAWAPAESASAGVLELARLSAARVASTTVHSAVPMEPPTRWKIDSAVVARPISAWARFW